MYEILGRLFMRPDIATINRLSVKGNKISISINNIVVEIDLLVLCECNNKNKLDLYYCQILEKVGLPIA